MVRSGTTTSSKFDNVRVMRVHGDLILGGVTDKTLVVGEGYI